MHTYCVSYIAAGKCCSRCAERKGIETLELEKDVLRFITDSIHDAEEVYEIGEIDDEIYHQVRAFSQDLTLICGMCNRRDGIDRVNHKVQRDIIQAILNGRTALLKERFNKKKEKGQKSKVAYIARR